MIRRQLINFQNRSVDVRVGLGAFDELPRMFASAVGKPKRAMVVWNDATSERFGEGVDQRMLDDLTKTLGCDLADPFQCSWQRSPALPRRKGCSPPPGSEQRHGTVHGSAALCVQR